MLKYEIEKDKTYFVFTKILYFFLNENKKFLKKLLYKIYNLFNYYSAQEFSSISTFLPHAGF